MIGANLESVSTAPDSPALVVGAFAAVFAVFALYGFLGRWLRTKGFRLNGDGGSGYQLAWPFFIWAAPGSSLIAIVLAVVSLVARG